MGMPVACRKTLPAEMEPFTHSCPGKCASMWRTRTVLLAAGACAADPPHTHFTLYAYTHAVLLGKPGYEAHSLVASRCWGTWL